MVDSNELKEGEELDFVEIEKGLFVLARKEKIAEMARSKITPQFETAGKSPQAPAAPVQSPQQAGLNAFFKRELDSKGFVVVFDEKGAQGVSNDFEKEIKRGAIVGGRGVDKKFYLATRVFMEETTPKLARVLKDGPLGMEDIAVKAKLSVDGVKALLCLLMEEGEVIEKKKGLFALA